MTDATTESMTLAARLYYLDGLGQHEIAAILGVSRSKVSRLLTVARERGIVRISIDPYEPRDADLERRLVDRFGLRRAVVVKVGDRPAASARRAVGHFAAPPIAAIIAPGATVGVAGGRTLGELVGAIPAADGLRDVAVVQLMGHVDPTARKMDAPELGRGLAQRVRGSFSTLAAPVFAPDRETRDAFLAHDHIRLVHGRFAALDLAFVGVGTLEDSVFIERGVLAEADYARLRALGAVGEICGRFFDAAGQECASPYCDRVIGIDLDELRRCPEVVAVTHGPSRRAAVQAALAGGLVTSLVVDDLGAAALLAPADDARAPSTRAPVPTTTTTTPADAGIDPGVDPTLSLSPAKGAPIDRVGSRQAQVATAAGEAARGGHPVANDRSGRVAVDEEEQWTVRSRAAG